MATTKKQNVVLLVGNKYIECIGRNGTIISILWTMDKDKAMQIKESEFDAFVRKWGVQHLETENI